MKKSTSTNQGNAIKIKAIHTMGMKKSTSTNQGNQDGGDRRRSGTPSVGAEERETGEPASTDRIATGASGEDDGDREREGRREWRGGAARVEAAA